MSLRSEISRFVFPVTIVLLLAFPIPSKAQNRITNIPDLNGDGNSDLIWYKPATSQSVVWLMSGTSISTSDNLPAFPSWKIAAVADFNGDGKDDIIWYNPSNGQIIEWLMNGTSIASSVILLNDPLWKVVEAADLNGDGMSDLLWHNDSTGQTVAWLMNGTSITSWSLLLTDPDLKLTATADFNGDGKADLLWYNQTTGQTVAWLMNGTTRLSGATLVIDPNWKVAATADFNHDRMADILWYNAATGETALWLMNGTTLTDSVALLTDPIWKVTTIADLNGDDMADLLWYNRVTGQTTLWLMNGTRVLTNASLLTDPNWTINATADLNGDHKSDLLWYNPATGQTWVWLMNGPIGADSASLSSDPAWQLQCIKTPSLTSVLTCDDVLVKASTGDVAVPNQPPVVYAGPDQSVLQSAGALLSGTASDDGLPTGSSLTKTWSQISGPSTVTFANSSTLSTYAAFPAAGTYTLRLTVSDGSLSSSDDVVITVNSSTSANSAPVVNAGPDQNITLPAAALLSGTATDDGLPAGSTLTKTWSRISGPSTVTFANSSALSTYAAFPATGTYTLRLTVSDGSLSASDDVVITVNLVTPANAAPVVYAGPDTTIALQNGITLSGSATDDSLPTGTLTTTWTKVGGPGTVVFVNANSVNATATFSAAGTYTLRLSATDGALTTADDVTIVVNSCGTAVSGTVTIMANATDDVGVASVQLNLDGANFGSSITTAPYSIPWNTTTTSNGCHIISVIAQDDAGNLGTASLSTMVNNP